MKGNRDSPPRDRAADDNEFYRELKAKQKRKLRAIRQGDRSVWFGLGMFGLVGWSVAVPTLLFTAIGIWIDVTFGGRYSWTLMLLILGVILGCMNAWFWVNREQSIIEKERDPEAGTEGNTVEK